MSCKITYKDKVYSEEEFKKIVQTIERKDSVLFMTYESLETIENKFSSRELYSLVKTIDKIWYDLIKKSGLLMIEYFAQPDLADDVLYNAARDILTEKLNETSDQELKDKFKFIIDNWNDVRLFHARNSQTFVVNLQEAENDPTVIKTRVEGFTHEANIEDNPEDNLKNLEEEEETNDKNESDNRSGNEISSIDGAYRETRALVRGLSKKVKNPDGTVSDQLNDFGFPELVDFYYTWNNLALNLQGLQELPKMIGRMHKLSKIHPEYQELIEVLTFDDPTLSGTIDPYLSLQLTKFRQDFSRTYIPIDQHIIEFDRINVSASDLYGNDLPGGMFEEDNVEVTTGIRFKVFEATRINESALEKLFYDNFATAPEGKYINKTSDGLNLLSKEVFNIDISNKKGQVEFLDAVGIKLSNATLRDSRTTDILTKAVPWFRNALLKASETKTLLNPLEIIKKAEARNLNNLLKIEGFYNVVLPTGTVKNAEGENQYALSTNNFITLTQAYLNDSETFPNYFDLVSLPHLSHLDYRNNPNVKNSVWLKNMFNLETGERLKDDSGSFKQIQLRNYNGLKVVDKSDVSGSSTTKLSIIDKELQDLNIFLISGSKEMMRAGDKSTAYSLVLLGKYKQSFGAEVGKNSNLPVALDNFLNYGTAGGDQMVSIMNGYLVDELNRISNFKKGVGKNIKTYNKLAGEFNLFRDILKKDKTLSDDLLKEQLAPNEIVSKYQDRLKKAYTLFFAEEAIEFYNYLKNYYGLPFDSFDTMKFLDRDIRDKFKAAKNPNTIQPFMAYIVNMFITHVEQTKIFNGDSAFFKDFHKRSSKDNTSGKTMTTDQWFLDALKRDKKFNYQAKLKGIETTPSNVTNVVVFKDMIFKSNYLDTWKEDLEKAIELEKNPKRKERLRKIADGILEEYKENNEADAQGIITLDFYRTVSLAMGNWTVAQDDAYIKVSKGESLSIEESALFPPKKLKYAGPLVVDGLYAPAFHKFSLYPIIPSVVKGKKLERLNDLMIEQNIGYALFESGSKVASVVNDQGEHEDFYKDYESREELPQNHKFNTVQKIYNHYIIEQINVAPEWKEETIYGTQFRKLLFQNLYNKGEAMHPWAKLLHEEYNSVLNQLTRIEKSDLMSQLGIEVVPKGESKLMEITDKNKGISKILEQAYRRGLNNNVKSFFSKKYPMEASHMFKSFQDLLMGAINRKLIRQKMNGDQMIQVASTGFEPLGFKKPTKKELDKYGSNDLKFYRLGADGNVEAAQVKMALTENFKALLYFTHKDGRPIRTLERLNEMLKDSIWVSKNRKSITLVGYRIPTQGLNSMEVFEIAEFLPSEAGNILVVPPELTKKAGSDFDIDKLSVFYPNFNIRKKGAKEILGAEYVDLSNFKDIQDIENYVVKNYPNRKQKAKEFNEKRKEISKRIDEIYKNPELNSRQKRDLSEPIREEYDLLKYEMKQELEPLYEYKAALQNRIIEIASSVLSRPENFIQLLRPNSTDLIRPLVMKDGGIKEKNGYAKNTDYTGTAIFTHKTQREKTLAALAGKRAIGIPVYSNTFGVLFQESGFANKPHLNPFNNKSDLSEAYDDDGELKNEFFSQMINAYVDVLNDDFIFYANAVYELGGLINYLKWTGVSTERIFYFINHPVIKDYVKNMRVNKSLFLKRLYPDVYGTVDGLAYVLRVQNKYTQNKYPKELNQIILDNPRFFEKNYLKNQISKPLSEIDPLEQAAIMGTYRIFQKQSQNTRKVQFVSNYDTIRKNHPLQSYKRMKDRKVLLNNQEFVYTPKMIEDLKNKTILKTFDHDQFVTRVMELFFPNVYNKQMKDLAVDLYSDTVQPRLESGDELIDANYFFGKFLSDFILFVYMNYTNSGKTAASLLFGPDYVGDSLVSVKQRFPELIDKYPLLRQLRSYPDEKNKKIKYIELLRPDSTTAAQDSLIEQFEELAASPIEEVRTLMKKIVIAGFVQGGMTKGKFSLYDIIPNDLIVPVIDAGFKNFLATEENLNKKGLSGYKIYSEIFRKVYPGFFKDGPERSNSDFEDPNRRFKNFYIPVIEEQIKQGNKQQPENKVSKNDIYSKLGNKTQSENVSIESWENLKNQKRAISPISIISTRIPNTNEHFGNPFSHNPAGKTQGLIKTETIKEAVEKYIDWIINGANFEKKNLFIVNPIQSVDKKAVIKAAIATQYIGFGEGIINSSTELYRQQAGQYANTGNYTEKDTIFVSVGGKRGTEQQQKEQQDRTIKEALKAIETGAVLITDNKSYVESNRYNTGEKRFSQNLIAKGYNYTEKTIDGQILGVWYKGELNPLRSQWIREQLKSGKHKGKVILYYKELGEPSHATALDYLINKYDWGQKLRIEIKSLDYLEDRIKASNVPDYVKHSLNSQNLEDLLKNIYEQVKGGARKDTIEFFGDEALVDYIIDYVEANMDTSQFEIKLIDMDKIDELIEKSKKCNL